MWFRTLFDALKPGAARRPARPARPGTSRRQPAPLRLSVEALDDRIVPTTLSVGNATVIEGDAGARYALVNVTLDRPKNETVSVKYVTADGTAKAGSDYGAASGQLTFARGETSKTIAVPVYGDGLIEANETFFIKLSEAKRADIGGGQGVVTIVDDDPPVSPGRVGVSIGDAEGTVVSTQSGTTGTTLHFTVRLAAALDQAVTVSYATADGTATAGVDYVATSGTLTFAPGETTKTIAVQVIGNDFGLDERFYVNLGGASDNAQVVDGQGVGTIHYYVQQPGDPGDACTPDYPGYPNC